MLLLLLLLLVVVVVMGVLLMLKTSCRPMSKKEQAKGDTDVTRCVTPIITTGVALCFIKVRRRAEPHRTGAQDQGCEPKRCVAVLHCNTW